MPAGCASELDQIPGVGEKTVTKLLRHFGSLERVLGATEGELREIVGRSATRRLLAHFAAQRAANELRVIG